MTIPKLSLMSALLCLGFGPAHADDTTSTQPIVIELFTSQGCSSCPPADELLGELGQKPHIIALSYHVDYWNYIGWQDPFSSKAYSQYQRRYAAAMNSNRVYTPQMVVNGRHDVVGSRTSKVRRTISNAAHDIAPLTASATQQADGSTQLRIDADENLAGAEIILVTTTPKITTSVKRGENSGRMLTNHHVVRSRNTLGVFTANMAPINVTINAGQQATILLQDKRSMRILAAGRI